MTPDTSVPEMPYILLRASQELFGKAPGELDDAQRSAAVQQAQREYSLENRILATPEAAAVIVAEQEVERAVATVRERYSDETAFAEDLAGNGLGVAALQRALYRQCKVESVLEKIALDAPVATDVDVGLFYHTHRSRFHVPESRELFHILITVNEEDAKPQSDAADSKSGAAENSRDAAWARIQGIALQLAKKPHRFAELAQRYSECPTALQGGRIGTVPRGQLYEAVETVLFQLRENQIGAPVESPMGFHIVKCGAIQRAHTVSLADASPGIRRHLNKRFKENRQKSWIASLPCGAPPPAPESQP